MPFEINKEAWEALAKEVSDGVITARMNAVADACNLAAGIEDGYRVGTEGDGERLEKHDFRQTVITATAEAQAINAKYHYLESNFGLATG